MVHPSCTRGKTVHVKESEQSVHSSWYIVTKKHITFIFDPHRKWWFGRHFTEFPSPLIRTKTVVMRVICCAVAADASIPAGPSIQLSQIAGCLCLLTFFSGISSWTITDEVGSKQPSLLACPVTITVVRAWLKWEEYYVIDGYFRFVGQQLRRVLFNREESSICSSLRPAMPT